MSWLAVGLGAAIGAWLRWGLGTLVANLSGGYVMGLAMAFFYGHNGISPEWRLFLISGLLGGLTTFSTFSA